MCVCVCVCVAWAHADLVNAVLGDMEEIRKAQQKLDEVQAALREAEQREQESKQAKRELDAALKDVKDQVRPHFLCKAQISKS